MLAIQRFMTGSDSAVDALLGAPPLKIFLDQQAISRLSGEVKSLQESRIVAMRSERKAEADFSDAQSVSSQIAVLRKQMITNSANDAQLQIDATESEARRLFMHPLAIGGNTGGSAVDMTMQTPGGRDYAAITAEQMSRMSKYPLGPISQAQLVDDGFTQFGQAITGVASWYGPGFDGDPTASGAIYDENLWTCASQTLPFGTLLFVTSGQYGVLVYVNDRGPYANGRVLDLSHVAAIALHSTGLVNVNAYIMVPPP